MSLKSVPSGRAQLMTEEPANAVDPIPRRSVRVLYSFPHKLGAGRICYTAWQQVRGLMTAGADVTIMPGSLYRALGPNVRLMPTLSWGKLRIPYNVVGIKRACALHDRIVARRLRSLAGEIDIVHAWPGAALETLKTARELGIPTVLERPNTHTRYAYRVVQEECERIGVPLPPGSEHAYDAAVLQREEAEFRLADRLLCPSDFVVRTFIDEGFPGAQLARHMYGVDERVFYADPGNGAESAGLRVIFVGLCAVRKGLHLALEAWLKSSASQMGTFMIAGSFIPKYEEKLKPMLEHPSVRVLRHRNDVPELLRRSDILVLPSIEEGSSLVCAEAIASGCVPLVSNVSSASCRHMENSLVHDVGDVGTLTEHLNRLDADRGLLRKLRANGMRDVPQMTWDAAGERLLQVYRDVIASKPRNSVSESPRSN